MTDIFLILAAGFSSRFQEGQKALYRFNNKTLIERTIELAKYIDANPIIITGFNSKLIVNFLKTQNINASCAFNPKFEQGMFSSIIHGFNVIKNEYKLAKNIFVMPVDIPFVSPETIKIMKKESDENHILIPSHKEKAGHPPLIPSKFVPEIISYTGTNGLQGFFRSHKKYVKYLCVDDEKILKNINRLEDIIP